MSNKICSEYQRNELKYFPSIARLLYCLRLIEFVAVIFDRFNLFSFLCPILKPIWLIVKLLYWLPQLEYFYLLIGLIGTNYNLLSPLFVILFKMEVHSYSLWTFLYEILGKIGLSSSSIIFMDPLIEMSYRLDLIKFLAYYNEILSFGSIFTILSIKLVRFDGYIYFNSLKSILNCFSSKFIAY